MNLYRRLVLGAAVLCLMAVAHYTSFSSNPAVAQPPAQVQTPSQHLLRFKAIRTTFDGAKSRSPQVIRAKIHGGWLVTVAPNIEGMPTQGVTFVPDPDHQWNGGSIRN